MRSQIEGSQAIARAVALCRPNVVPAYPITPQTHVVEAIGAMVKGGSLSGCEFITVESEFAAMSAAIGASAAGGRTYTATASQGLLYMAEALFNASGLGLPVVLTVANRAIGAPINIWNDQSDSMSMRDCGWIQLFARDNQDAADLHVVAFALAEELSVPVMVCVDGFVLTHAFEPIDLPEQDQVDAFLPGYQPRQLLDVTDPVSIGSMVGPEAFTEVRYLSHYQQLRALEVFPELAARFATTVGRELPVIETYRTENARVLVVTLGSVTGTLKDVADEFNGEIGIVTPLVYRPFPSDELRAALAGAQRVIVLERAFAPGAGGVVTPDVRAALATGTSKTVHTVIAGLGGRAISTASLRALFSDALAGELSDALMFLDLREDLVNSEIERMRATRKSGPHTLSLLRAAGVPASRIG